MKRSRAANNKILALVGYISFAFVAFGFSYVFLSSYKLGDQVFYRDLYSALETASIYEIFVLQSFYTGSSEPVYGLLTWFGASLRIDKDIYFSLLNCLFCLILLRLLLRNNSTKLYTTLVFLNFYIFVLFGPAERLKVAFLLMLFAIAMARIHWKFLFLSIAILSHFQLLILLVAGAAGFFSGFTSRQSVDLRKGVTFVAGLLMLTVFFWWFYLNYSGAIYEKINSYSNEKGILAISDIFILSTISLLIFRGKVQVISALAVTAVAAAFVGPERINMLAFFIFSAFAVGEKKTSHPIVLAIMFYFAIKGIYFAVDVFVYGTGFR